MSNQSNASVSASQRLWTERIRILTLCMYLSMTIGLAACAGHFAADPEVTVSQIEPSGHAVKAADCSMDVLYSEPTVAFRKIAIVEGWADSNVQRGDLFEAIKRAACGTGADALLVISDRAQTTHRSVYDPDNEQPGEAGDNSASEDKGKAILEKEHVSKIGEPGHSGYYIDTVAVVFNDHS